MNEIKNGFGMNCAGRKGTSLLFGFMTYLTMFKKIRFLWDVLEEIYYATQEIDQWIRNQKLY